MNSISPLRALFNVVFHGWRFSRGAPIGQEDRGDTLCGLVVNACDGSYYSVCADTWHPTTLSRRLRAALEMPRPTTPGLAAAWLRALRGHWYLHRGETFLMRRPRASNAPAICKYSTGGAAHFVAYPDDLAQMTFREVMRL